MTIVIRDRVRETTESVGTGEITLAGAPLGSQTFETLGTGSVTYYAIVDPVSGAWEVGQGTYNEVGNRLSRDTVLDSSNNGSLVGFTTGTKEVFVTYPAAAVVFREDFDAVAAQLAALDAAAVRVTGDQTIAGVKTFSDNPVSSAAQSAAAGSLTRRDFVDGLDAANVKLTGAQTIEGVKTFDSNPRSSAPQGLDNDSLTRRDFVLEQIATGGDAQVVRLTGDQTIAGVKTFSSNPISSAAQSTDINALTRRDFVDGLDVNNVKLSGNQTIAGVKTFSSNPLSSAAQGTDINALTRRDFVDGLDANNVKLTGTQTITGAKLVSAGNFFRFVHFNESGTDDGKIGTNLFASGLNILGAQTQAGQGRVVRIWGSVMDHTGDLYLRASTGVGVTNTQTISGLKTFTGGLRATGAGAVATNTAVGPSTLGVNTSGARNSGFGNLALSSCTTGSDNVGFGSSALQNLTTGTRCTGVGYNSLQTSTNIANCSGLGSGSAVTGNNQVQLGDSSTTTYVYGTVQNRSDIRDKADVRDTVLGLDFISALRPVDYRWDLRDAYKPEAPQAPGEDATAAELAAYKAAMTQWAETCKLDNITRDGSKKRTRFHHGLIAQEVKAALESQGVDFGGFQDHSVAGGEAVMSLGYDELIAPLIKAVQELKAEVDALKAANQG